MSRWRQGRRPAAWHNAWAIPLAVVGFLGLGAVLAAAALPATLAAENAEGVDQPYAIVPASADGTSSRVRFDAVPRYPATGSLMFVTVREPELSLLDWFIGDPEPEVQPRTYVEKYGTRTPEQQQQINVQLMAGAKEVAEYVALGRLGYPVELVKGKVIVRQIGCVEANEDRTECVEYVPSGDFLKVGDTIVTVEGVAIGTTDDLDAVFASHGPGDVVSITVDRPGEGNVSGEIELTAFPEEPERARIGINLVDTSTTKLPFDVDIDSGNIGGPSAGLAFTLALLDELTPGELTGGKQVAVTGTINLDGSVGAIGGLVSKASAVRQRGAEVFIIPASQSEEDIALAREVAGPGVQVITVADLDEALAALAGLGGNALELGRPGESYTPPAS